MFFDPHNPPNWLGAENPFVLPQPPLWVLKRLWDRDPALRIMPGLSQCCYRVARRSRVMANIKPVLGNDSETGRMCRERCIPVVALISQPNWHRLFQWLDDHDGWKYRDPADRVEELEREAAAKDDAASADEADQRGVSAWHALQMRKGEKVFVQRPTTWTLGNNDGNLDAKRTASQAEGLPADSEAQHPIRAEGAVLVSGAVQGQP